MHKPFSATFADFLFSGSGGGGDDVGGDNGVGDDDVVEAAAAAWIVLREFVSKLQSIQKVMM
jgi:hypothetical protein